MATLLNPRAPCLRQVAGSTFRAYAVLSRSQMATQYISASFARPLKQLCISSDRRGPVTSRDSSQRTPGLTTSALRHASTSGTSPNPQPTPPDLLTWDRFFKLRKTRRYINLGASVATAVPAVWFGMPYMVEKDLDSWAAQVSGLEPFIALPILGVLAAGAGWLCGPSFGTLGFKMWAGRRGWNQMIAEKEKTFYARIKRYRADPSSSSPSSPIPDYYGEKIASVKDYRRWLKDQRAFNLKRSKNMI